MVISNHIISGKTKFIAHIGFPTHSFTAPKILNPCFKLLNKDSILIIDDFNTVQESISKNNKVEENSISKNEFLSSIEKFQKILISEYENKVDITFKTGPQPAFNKRMELLNEKRNETDNGKLEKKCSK